MEARVLSSSVMASRPIDTELDEIRARVERKRKAKERIELLDELYGRTDEIDPDAVYLTVRELSEKINCGKHVVLNAISVGNLRARKSGNARFHLNQQGFRGGYRARWYIHPDDAKRWAKRHLMYDLQLD
jgi:hypothetical protein